jgi:hypothetical protein
VQNEEANTVKHKTCRGLNAWRHLWFVQTIGVFDLRHTRAAVLNALQRQRLMNATLLPKNSFMNL